MYTQLEEQLIIANWFYSLGQPPISDKKYDELYRMLKEQKPDSELILKTWSEFPKPVEVLKKYNLLETSQKMEDELSEKQGVEETFFLPKKNMELRYKYYNDTIEYFNQFIPKSIETIDDMSDSISWYNTLADKDGKVTLNLSLKGDGFNISLFYYEGYYIGARTRGRSGTSEDVSIAMSRVVPMQIPVNVTYARIKCEAVVDKSKVAELRAQDPTKWKSARSSVKTLLMNTAGEEYNKLLMPLAFKLEGMVFDTMEEEFNFMSHCGFLVIENETFVFNSHEDFINAIKSFADIECIYATDGVVVTVNDSEQYKSLGVSGKYDGGIKAYRLFNWKSNIYCSIMMGIEESYSTKNISLKAKIIPTTVTNGSTQVHLDVDNPSRLQNAKVTRGSIMAFIMQSDSCIVWLDDVSFIINNALRQKVKLPQHLVQPVAELEHRLKTMLENGVDFKQFM